MHRLQTRQHTRTKQEHTETVTDYNLCGDNHKKTKIEMSCLGQTCDGCHGRNHFKVKCRKTEVHAMGTNENLDDSDAKWFPSVDRKSPRKRVTALINVNESDVMFQLDNA